MYLLDSLTEYIVYIMGEKSFFEALFASRIDTLTDNTGLIYIILMAMGEGSGHIQSLILTAILVMMGFQTITIGLLGDTISANRKLLEDVQYRVRKMECGKSDEERKHEKSQ